MKIAALIVGLIGALLTAGLGAKWVSDYEQNKEMIQSLQKLTASLGADAGANPAMAELGKLHTAGYAMIVLGLLSLVAAGLVFKLTRPSGAVMIASAVVPAIFAPASLIASFPLLIAGGLALFARSKKPLAAVAVQAAAA